MNCPSCGGKVKYWEDLSVGEKIYYCVNVEDTCTAGFVINALDMSPEVRLRCK